MTIDDQVARLRPGRQHRPRPVAALRHARCSGIPEGRGPNPEHLYFRMDELSARIVVVPGEQDRLQAMGWEVADHRALAEAVDHLKHHGVEVETGTPEELAERRVEGMVRFQRPLRERLRALPRGDVREPARRHAVRPDLRDRRAGDGPHRRPGQRRRRGAALLRRRARLPAARLDADAGGVRRQGAGIDGVAAVPGLQPAAPQPGVPADAEPEQVRAHHGRGRRSSTTWAARWSGCASTRCTSVRHWAGT